LLDWTEGALIARYFAVRNKLDETDAAVWVLDPWRLNEHVLGIEEVIAPSADAGLLKLDAKRYDLRLPARYRESKALNVKSPVAIYPTHFARPLVRRGRVSLFTDQFETVLRHFLRKCDRKP
jgi:hypothetical protein